MFLSKIWEDEPTPVQITTEYREAIDIFPALHIYKEEHSLKNLQKLCVEIEEFCRAVYSSTRNEEERRVFNKMIDKLSKI